MAAAVLVLAHGIDAGAAAVAARVRHRLGPASVLWLAPEQLAFARWSHRIDRTGQASTRLLLPDGRVLDGDSAPVIWNRLRHLPQPHFRRASPRDIDYAGAELQALVVSWLGALGARVVPEVRRHPWPCLPSGWAERRRWALAAAARGVPVDPELTRVSPPTSTRVAAAVSRVLVAGRLASGDLASVLGPACLRAAAALDLPLLEFRFIVEGATPRLMDIEPMPPLLGAGDADTVAAFLADRAQAPAAT